MNPGRETRASRATLWLIGLGCLALTIAIYYPALTLYYMGDDVAFVHPDREWLRHSLLPGSAWHYYPLNQFLLYGISALCDWHVELPHALNLLLHVGIGTGLALWLRRMGTDWRVWTIAPFFFIARGVGYEVVAWITELSYLMVVAFTLLTLWTWGRYLEGRGTRYLTWTVVGFTLALLSIEHALVLVPLFLLYDLILRPEKSLAHHLPWPWRSGAYDWRGEGARLLRGGLRYVPFALVVIAFLGVKFMNSHALLLTQVAAAEHAAAPPVISGFDLTSRLPADRTWFGILNTPPRAYHDLLLSASYLFLPIRTCFAPEDTLLTRVAWVALLPWLAVHVWALWKGRPVTRFLIAWMYVYLLPLAVASAPAARYYYLAAVPASGLVGIAVTAAWNRLGRRFDGRVLGAATVALMLLLIAGEARFARARMAEWREASDLVQGSVTLLQRDLTPSVKKVYLFNLPRGVPGPYWIAYAFMNAAEYLNVMVRPPRWDVTVYPVYDRSFVDERWPTIGRYATRAEILAKLGAGDAVGYEFVTAPPRLVPLR